jgi:prepilin-type N-terminal cleavage/methylation domain-containing protein
MRKYLNKFAFISEGFTLLELLLVISILGILATTVFTAVNPSRQLAKARDADRESDLIAILSAVLQYSSEHSGELPDTDGNPNTSNFPTTLTCIGNGGTCFDLASAGETGETIVPVYMVEMPKDPKVGTDADTGYLIMVDANGHLIASASGETKAITVKR